MKKVTLFLALFAIGVLYAEDNVRVQQILTYPYSFLRDAVRLEGKVIKYSDEKTKNSKCYIFQDDYGDTIKVFTIANLPKVDQRYEITGMVTIVDIEGDRKEVNIFENKIVRLPNGQPGNESLPATSQATTGTTGTTGTTSGLVNTLFAIAAVLLLLIAVIAIIMIVSKQPKYSSTPSYTAYPGDTESDPGASTETPGVIEDKAFRMTFSSDQTLEILPGRLEFIQGGDVYRDIKFYKDSTKKESEFTFGREPGNDYNYIQLKNPTVSAKQAKLFWTNGKYILLNYSTVNSTKVNGNILAKDESVALDYGCEIEMGEVIFKLLEK